MGVQRVNQTNTEIRAPFDGVVLIKPEQPVEIVLDALPEMRFRGNVARIVPTVDRAKATVMTKVRFETLDPRILPKMSAKVAFLSRAATAEDQRPLIAINPKTLVTRDGKTWVFKIGADNRVQAVGVVAGRAIGDLQAVTGATLKAGERLVLSPADTLQDGARVSVVAK